MQTCEKEEAANNCHSGLDPESNLLILAYIERQNQVLKLDRQGSVWHFCTFTKAFLE
jgi:hypothetical protein